MQFAVVTGILRVVKEGIFSGLNNLSVYTVLDSDFSDYFGLVDNEVKQGVGIL
ncbi:AAA family ATPase [Leptotrichia buccalis]|uniref:AAA family ATPase n=1 Tax=Leptotrichia buccalis TaxID=40542 RepID=UPI00019EAC5B